MKTCIGVELARGARSTASGTSRVGVGVNGAVGASFHVSSTSTSRVRAGAAGSAHVARDSTRRTRILASGAISTAHTHTTLDRVSNHSRCHGSRHTLASLAMCAETTGRGSKKRVRRQNASHDSARVKT
jgi:hypothetical protein